MEGDVVWSWVAQFLGEAFALSVEVGSVSVDVGVAKDILVTFRQSLEHRDEFRGDCEHSWLAYLEGCYPYLNA